MTPVIVTKTGTKIHVDFNDFTQVSETRKACFPDIGILAVMIKDLGDGEFIEVHIESPDNRWKISLDGNNQSLIIGTVNNIVPSTIDELQALICDLMA